LEQAERSRRKAEGDCSAAQEAANDLSVQNASLSANKRKFEGEIQVLHSELDEAIQLLRSSEDKSKKAMLDAAGLSDALRQEQEHSQHIDRMRKGLEIQIKEMQARLDEAETAALKGGKRVIQKLEQRVREVEGDLDGEQRRHQETMKNLRKQDRRVKELQFQCDEDKKNVEKMHELIEKLQNKLKVYKKQIDEAEQVGSANLAKYRQLQLQMDDAQERADMAENSLMKVRARQRGAATYGPPSSSLAKSASTSVVRSSSRARVSDE